MGLIVNRNANRSDLQKRVTERLREKSQQTVNVEDVKTEFGFDDPTRDKTPMDKMTLAWIVVGCVAAGIITAFFVLR